MRTHHDEPRGRRHADVAGIRCGTAGQCRPAQAATPGTLISTSSRRFAANAKLACHAEWAISPQNRLREGPHRDRQDTARRERRRESGRQRGRHAAVVRLRAGPHRGRHDNCSVRARGVKNTPLLRRGWRATPLMRVCPALQFRRAIPRSSRARLAANADVEQASDDGATPLAIACQKVPRLGSSSSFSLLRRQPHLSLRRAATRRSRRQRLGHHDIAPGSSAAASGRRRSTTSRPAARARARAVARRRRHPRRRRARRADAALARAGPRGGGPRGGGHGGLPRPRGGEAVEPQDAQVLPGAGARARRRAAAGGAVLQAPSERLPGGVRGVGDHRDAARGHARLPAAGRSCSRRTLQYS